MFPQYGGFAQPNMGFGGYPQYGQPQPAYNLGAVRPMQSQPQPIIRQAVGGFGGFGAPVMSPYGAQMQPRVVQAQGRYQLGGYTQTAYQTRHSTDTKLQKLKDVRASCQLGQIPVEAALLAFKRAATDEQLKKDDFYGAYAELLTAHGVAVPSKDIQDATFDLFDRDGNGVVDMMELCCALSLLCKGDEDDKIAAVFKAFDENGDGFISKEEMSTFLRSVFRVVLTPAVKGVMAAQGVRVESAEELADATMEECFKQADINSDGKLTIGEFRKWFYASGVDPSVVFSPLKNILH